jgi:hypothetical protein
MNIPDLINGGYEALGGVLILNHCRAVIRDKAVAGVSILSTSLFMTWGIWNLYYYPHLDQWASVSGGLLIVSANALWVGLLLRYRRRA